MSNGVEFGVTADGGEGGAAVDDVLVMAGLVAVFGGGPFVDVEAVIGDVAGTGTVWVMEPWGVGRWLETLAW